VYGGSIPPSASTSFQVSIALYAPSLTFFHSHVL
jgi:hypothetical protein